MTTLDDLSDYELFVGEPYLTQNLTGKYVVLQDEELSRQGGIVLWSSEILIDDNPSKKDIFEFKLRGAYRTKMWNTKLP